MTQARNSRKVVLISFGLGECRTKPIGLAESGRLVALAECLGFLDLFDGGLGRLDHRLRRVALASGRVGIASAKRRQCRGLGLLALSQRLVRIAAVLGELQPLRTEAGRLAPYRLQRCLDLTGIGEQSPHALDPSQE